MGPNRIQSWDQNIKCWSCPEFVQIYINIREWVHIRDGDPIPQMRLNCWESQSRSDTTKPGPVEPCNIHNIKGQVMTSTSNNKNSLWRKCNDILKIGQTFAVHPLWVSCVCKWPSYLRSDWFPIVIGSPGLGGKDARIVGYWSQTDTTSNITTMDIPFLNPGQIFKGFGEKMHQLNFVLLV